MYVSAKYGIPNSLEFPNIGRNFDDCVSDFRISGQSVMKGNCHNSRTSDDIDMKLGPVTQLETKQLKKI